MNFNQCGRIKVNKLFSARYLKKKKKNLTEQRYMIDITPPCVLYKSDYTIYIRRHLFVQFIKYILGR